MLINPVNKSPLPGGGRGNITQESVAIRRQKIRGL